MLTADDLQVLFIELFPEALINELASEFGVVERQRKIELRAFIPALVLGVGAPDGELQADALRLVGTPTPKSHCFFLTNLPPRIGPWQVGDLYRIRWEVEIANKLDKNVHQLDETQTTKPTTVRTMLHADLMASIITAIVVHRHHLATRSKRGDQREVAPFHPMQAARVLYKQGVLLAYALEMEALGEAGKARSAWEYVAMKLNTKATDPNWRRRPSTLDREPTPSRKAAKRASHAKAILK